MHLSVGWSSELVTGTDTAVILYTWRPAGRKTRVGTLTEDNCVSGGIIANFLNRGFQTRTLPDKGIGAPQLWRRLRNVHVLLHVRANGDSPVSRR